MPVDPRLTGFQPPSLVPGADPAIAQLWAAIGDLTRKNSELQRQFNDMRAAAIIQTGSSSPSTAGLLGRDGTPYGQNAGTPAFWLRIGGGGWHGVSLPLT